MVTLEYALQLLQAQTGGPPAGSPSGGQGQGQGPLQGIFSNPLVPLVLMGVVFYFLMIAPARKQKKRTQEMLDSLKNGDKVITSGGIYGTIVRANQGEDSIRIRIAPTVEIDVLRSAVSGTQPEPQKGS